MIQAVEIDSPEMAQRKRLEPNELAEIGPSVTVDVPLDLIDPSPDNPRADLPRIEELAASIHDNGLLQPVLARRMGQRYQLLAGHRRWSAYLQLREQYPEDVRWRTLPAKVMTVDEDDQARLLLTAAQVQHEPWRAAEEKLMLGRWRTEGATLATIADRLHKDVSWVSLRLKVYEDPIVGPLVLNGSLLVSTAQELVAIRDEDVRRDLTAKAVAEGWSKSDARREVKAVTLTRQLRDVAARAKELLDLLSQVDASRLPPQAQEDLRDLSRRINILARGEKPVLPSVEGAMRAAGLNPEREARRPTARRGLKPKKK